MNTTTSSLRALSMSSENLLEEHREAADPQLARIFSIIGLSVSTLALAWIALMFFLHTQPRNHYSMSNFLSSYAIGLIIVFSMFLISSSLGFVYSKDLIERDAQDYQGRMRVVNVEYKRQYKTWTTSERDCVTTTSRSDGGTGTSNCRTTTTRHYHHYYDTIFTLDWGYEWACGNDGAVQCADSKYVYCSRTICRSRDCSSSDDERAFELAVDCGATIFDSDRTYEPFQASKPPSQDIDWPNLVLYGDCQTCEVIDSTASISTLERMGRAAIAFAAIGGAGRLIMSCTLLSSEMRKRPKKKKNTKPYKSQFVYQPYQLSQPTETARPQVQEEEVVVYADSFPDTTKEGSRNTPLGKFQDTDSVDTDTFQECAQVNDDVDEFHSCRVEK